ncbi:S-layer homology domain-containing protein [Desulforamulus putei DSM 12395]|uniref:S-layer homology domain-containing protein n=1 Tax=Desulforamulus putei DSM 12395 TaxID=1121429 RepID=A0A1M4U3C1_9FIRM|nr:S-layer homology domain-containing protein [Desulforamulus putei]SHE51126.1 S-layer homology domain-containing protein [Desulforamulus putei DSM 12395]
MYKSGFRSYIRSGSIVMTLLLLLNIFSFSSAQPALAEDPGQTPQTEQSDVSTEAGSANTSDPSVEEAVYQDENLDSIDSSQDNGTPSDDTSSVEEGANVETTEEPVTEAVDEEEIEAYTVSGAVYGISEEDTVKIMLSKCTGKTVVSQDLEIGQTAFSISDVPTGEYTLCMLINGATAMMKPVQVAGDMTVEDIHVVRVTGTILGLPEGVTASVYLKPENKDVMVMPLKVISNGDITEFTHKVVPGFYRMTVMAEGYEDYTAPEVIEVGDDDVILDPIEMVLKLEIVTTSLSTGTEGAAYSTELQATGGKEPLTWAITGGTLPEGLTLDTVTGVISGTPANSGDYSFEVTVTDFLGHTFSQTLNLSIARRSSGGSSGGSSSSSDSANSGTNTDVTKTTFTDREIKEAINLSQGTVTLVAPVGQKSLVLTGDQYKQLIETGKELIISVQDVKVVLNPAAIDFPENAKLEFKVEELADGKAVELVSQTDYQLIGKVFEINMEIKSDGNTEKNPLKQSVRVSLPVKSDLWLDGTHHRLDVFYYNESESKWEPMHAIHNTNGQVLTFSTPHFSKYAVLSKPEKNFSDVTGHWGQKDIERMAARGIIGGYQDHSFRPDANITRAELATLLSRLLGLNEKATITFSDVTEKDWHYESIAKAFQAGIVRGYHDGSFKPNQYVTREQMAAMIANALENEGISIGQNDASLGLFTDAGSISPWARQSVATASALGIVKGIISEQKVKFAPGKQATRAEATVMLARLLDITESAKLNL